MTNAALPDAPYVVVAVTYDEATLHRLKALARRRLPLGEIAKRMGRSLEDVRYIADTNRIMVVRDNRTGGPRTVLASHHSPAAHAADRRLEWLSAVAHRSRLASAPRLSEQEQADLIAQHLASKGVTHCPSVHLEGSAANEIVPSKLRGRGSLQVEL
ncbi:hypothetical protein EOD42_14010 [Rhodovarius crocodyli]|uniref:Uncharacterized protein n=1 Tax=Rhodovarius crocodyli TaxID=1979269 RepID=A0A437MEZ2_9PROT|nr:hypothetical protein [Rhodovarius crocodyli]RVT96224.1 hypothetical protein EOD42_14010 [Rhodovarius crocodyli]